MIINNVMNWLDKHPYIMLAMVFALCFLWLWYELKQSQRHWDANHKEAMINMRQQRFFRHMIKQVCCVDTYEQLRGCVNVIEGSGIAQEAPILHARLMNAVETSGNHLFYTGILNTIDLCVTKSALDGVVKLLESRNFKARSPELANKLFNKIDLQRAIIVGTVYSAEESDS